MNLELEKLIEFALSDGIITEKERSVLLKKAIELGVDVDEFEMVLDARLHKIQNEKSRIIDENIINKCPNCNDVIPPLSKVCTSCDYVIESSNTNNNSTKGLEETITDIEEALVKIKSLKQYTIFTSLLKHSYITLPILSLIFFIISIRLDNSIWILGLILGVISWRIIKKKIKVESNTNDVESYNVLKATFEKKSRNANTLFGQNRKVATLLNDLNNELNKIDIQKKKSAKNETILYCIIIILTICTYFIPQSKSEIEITALEMPLVIKAEEYIKNGNLIEVNKIISELKSSENIVLIRSKIQLHNLNIKLEEVESKIKSKKYSESELQLSKILWERISTDYNSEKIERDVYKVFLLRKENLNSMLPKKYQIKVEDEYSL